MVIYQEAISEKLQAYQAVQEVQARTSFVGAHLNHTGAAEIDHFSMCVQEGREPATSGVMGL